jgi:hypothetical protein
MREREMRNLRSRLGRRTRNIISVGVTLAVALIAAANIANAQSSTAQAVDTAVQVFAFAADVAGLPTGLDQDPAKTVVEGLVNCAVSGTSGGDCAKNVIVSAVLSEIGDSPDVDPTVAQIVSSAVPCLTSGSSVSSCLTTTAVSQLPPEAQPLVTCVLGGGNVGNCAVKSTEALIVQQLSQTTDPNAMQVINCIASQSPADCAKQALTQNLPDSIKPFATCLSQSGGTLQSCAANVLAGAVGQASPQAAALVACLGNTDGNAMQQCAVKAGLAQASAAAGQAVQQAADVISQLKVDAPATDPSKFPQQPAVLQNLVMLTQGIQTGDWVKMGAAAGSEILETAGKIILSVFVTPPVAGLLAPVVDAMIQNDANAALKALTNLQNGDVVGLTQTAFTWAATTLFSTECALFSGQAATDICNGLAGAVKDVSDFGGGLLKDALGDAKGILSSVGLWKPVDSVVSGAFDDVKTAIDDVFKGPTHTHSCSTDAASLQNYFNANFLICARNIADNESGGHSNAQNLVDACNATFQHCAAIAPACASMAPALQQIGANLSNKMGTAAAIYASGLPAFVKKAAAKGDNMCDANFWPEHFAELVAPCQSTLDGMVPANASCQLASYPDSDGQPPNPGGRQSASHNVCRQAIYAEMQGDASGLVGPNSQACQNQLAAQEVVDVIEHCHEVPIIVDGQAGFVTKECDPPFRGNGNLKPRPEFTGFPTFLGSSKNATVQIPLFHLLPASFAVPVIGGVRFTDRGGLLPFVGNGGANGINPDATPSGLKPIATKPFDNPQTGGGKSKQTNKNTGGGGSNGVSSDSGAPSSKGNAMDNAAAAATSGGLSGVAGSAGGAFGFGRVPPRVGGVAPKGGPVANTGGGHGGTNGVVGTSGNAPPSGGHGGTNGVVGTSGSAPPKPAAAPPPFIDAGGCAICGTPAQGDIHVR